MSNIADKLNYLNDTKKAIKTSIKNRGVDVSDDDTFRSYADKIDNIGETVEKIKFGLSIDDILGTIDEEGTYQNNYSRKNILDLTGVKKINYYDFAYKFYNNDNISEIKANDLINIGGSAFSYAFYESSIQKASFESLEEIKGDYTFNNAFYLASIKSLNFPKLKKISGKSAMANLTYSSKINIAKCFPVLEEINNEKVFSGFCYMSGAASNGVKFIFPKLIKITGASNLYDSTFGSPYTNNTKWEFPNATDFTGYIWNISTTYSSEIHFSVKNRETIESCNGYENKWGASGATIYFDLISNIIVNNIRYERDEPNSIVPDAIKTFTAWKDESNNIIYTDANTEPAIGTIVYSDEGITEFGTVSEVE